jgi:hypothetical protein
VIDIIKRSNQEPTQKFKFPQTTSQEIGWMTQPLVYNFFEILKVITHKLAFFTYFAWFAVDATAAENATTPRFILCYYVISVCFPYSNNFIKKNNQIVINLRRQYIDLLLKNRERSCFCCCCCCIFMHTYVLLK